MPITAIEMAASAMLKAGQNENSKKSITKPLNILSIKFPITPPRKIANNICVYFSLGNLL